MSAGGGPRRDPADLNRERAAIREDPELVQERVQRAATVFALTELREPRRSLADAWRIAVGDFSIDAEKATRAARDLKSWARRALAPSLAAHLLAAGVGPERLVEAIVEQTEAVKRKADGSIVCDPDGNPVPDLATRRRALPFLRDTLHMAGLLVKFMSDVDERLQRAGEHEDAGEADDRVIPMGERLA